MTLVLAIARRGRAHCRAAERRDGSRIAPSVAEGASRSGVWSSLLECSLFLRHGVKHATPSGIWWDVELETRAHVMQFSDFSPPSLHLLFRPFFLPAGYRLTSLTSY